MSAEPGIKAIVLTKRNPIRDALRAGMKTSGVKDEDVTYAKTKKACLDAIAKKEPVLLIIDWEFGTDEAIAVLASIRPTQQQHPIESFLIAAKMSEKIIAAGKEFGVSQVHTGDITKEKVKMLIDGLMKNLKSQAPLKLIMTAINEARSRGEWAKANEILEQLRAKEPTNDRLMLELAENYMAEKRWEDAFKLLEPIQSKNPPDTRGLHMIGKCLIKLGKHEEATEVMKKAKVINPYNVDRLIELGHCLLNQDKVEEAKENFNEAMTLAPTEVGAQKGVGTCLLMDGEVNEALELLNKSTSGLELASVFNTAAVLSMRAGRIPKGMDLYDAALKALSGQKDVLARLQYNKGLGFYRWKKKDEAKLCFEKALELDPSYENALHNLKAMANKAGDHQVKIKKDAPNAPAPGTPLDVSFDDSLDEAFNDNLSDLDEHL